MKLIVGLGNPGKKYELTRHNVGFMSIDAYLGNIQFKEKFNGQYYKTQINGEEIIFLKPQSYMNLSGEVVQKFSHFFKIETKNILIIRDDLDLPIGSAKIKFNSSSGGDNGIKSIINSLGTKEFGQYKIGISTDKMQDKINYVLGKFSKEELTILYKKIEESKDVIDYFIENDIFKTINKYNGEIK